MTALRYGVEILAWWVALAASKILPRRLVLRLGGGLGLAAYHALGSRRRITIQNIREAFGPELSEHEVHRIARASWCNLGRRTMEVLYFDRVGPQSVGRVVHYEGLEHIRGAYEKGRGVLLFSGHFGQWELTALMQGFMGLHLLLLTRPLDNPWLERALARRRTRSGNRIVHKRNAVRTLLRELRAGGGVAIVIDQDAGSDGVFVPFFGRAASTTPTLARLAMRTGAAVVPTLSVPLPDGTYRVIYDPEVRVPSSGNTDADARRLTADCTATIERWVRRWPEQWLWMHRRWKTRPPHDAAEPSAADCGDEPADRAVD